MQRLIRGRDPERLADDFSVDGKPYIIVAIGGGPYSGEYVAGTLHCERRTRAGHSKTK
jgi:hypothetical protein